MNLKNGTKFKVITGPFPGVSHYALKGWTGTIVRSFSDDKYVVAWDNEGMGGDLVYKKDIVSLNYKKKIKVFPIVEFMRNKQ